MQVHRLVWIVYRGLIKDDRVLNHKDGIKTNNSLFNLELVSDSCNVRHAHQNNLVTVQRGGEKPNSNFSDDQVRNLRKQFAESDGKKSVAKGTKKFNVSKCTLRSMLIGETYSHIKTGYESTNRRILSRRGIDAQKKRSIRKLRVEHGLSAKDIAERVGVSRNTVMKYWS